MRPRRLQLRETVEKSFHLAPPVHWKTTPTSKISQQEKSNRNLYAVNLGEKYKFASVSVNDTPLENINDPIKVTDQNLTVNATFELATGIEDVTAEATAYYNDKVLYMPQGATAVIYNLLGTAVAEATEMTTNLENLPAGIYLAKVSMGENTTIIRFKK